MADSIPFKQANTTLGAPTTMPDCMELQVFQDENEMISCWVFTTEELAEMQRTGRIWLRVAGNTHPPVALSPFHPWENK